MCDELNKKGFYAGIAIGTGKKAAAILERDEMEFQIDICKDDRTAEQDAILERYYQAAKILCAAGFKAKVVLFFVSKPTDNPACIELKR